MNIKLLNLLVGAVCFFASCGLAEEISGKVVGVHDGDTITVLAPENVQLKVRLEGIDAPELKQAFGNVSKVELSKTVFGKQVRLETTGTDIYGRTLADVFLGVEWVNESQVKAGVAWVYLKYSKYTKLLEAEAFANKSQRGLWRDEAPVAPWLWRQEKKAVSSAAK